jgi:preprotein translocase subunit SecE
MDYAKNPVSARRTSVLIVVTFASVILYGLAALAAFL